MRSKRMTKFAAVALSVTLILGSCLTVSASGYNGSGYSGSGYSGSSGGSKGGSSSSSKEDYVGTVKLSDGTVISTSVAGIYKSSYFKGMAVTAPASTVNAMMGVKGGESARITMTDSQCGEKAKAVLNKALNDTGAKLISTLDIYGSIVAKNGKVKAVDQLAGPVEFAVSIPEDMRNNVPAGYKISIIRIYGEAGVGHVDLLNNESDDASVFKFSTDKLGVFAFVYIKNV